MSCCGLAAVPLFVYTQFTWRRKKSNVSEGGGREGGEGEGRGERR